MFLQRKCVFTVVLAVTIDLSLTVQS